MLDCKLFFLGQCNFLTLVLDHLFEIFVERVSVRLSNVENIVKFLLL